MRLERSRCGTVDVRSATFKRLSVTRVLYILRPPEEVRAPEVHMLLHGSQRPVLFLHFSMTSHNEIFDSTASRGMLGHLRWRNTTVYTYSLDASFPDCLRNYSVQRNLQWSDPYNSREGLALYVIFSEM